MHPAATLREKAARLLRFSRAISNPKDVAHFEARAAEAEQAAQKIEAAEAVRFAAGSGN
jgi:hypothetical protein